MRTPSRLELVPSLHAGMTIFDISINGQLLRDRIVRHEDRCRALVNPGTSGYVSPLGWLPGAFDRLLLQEPPDLPGKRTSLMVCGLCGDLGCGAVSTVISRDVDLVLWQELGTSNNLELADEAPRLFQRVTSFEFDWEQYRAAILAARGAIT